jgi:Flp pilus assembly pilin Flp
MLNEFYARLFTIAARLREEEKGQGLAEYALILVFVSVVAIAALTALGGGISGVLDTVTGAF